jgi:hypothetical protein
VVHAAFGPFQSPPHRAAPNVHCWSPRPASLVHSRDCVSQLETELYHRVCAWLVETGQYLQQSCSEYVYGTDQGHSA